MAVKKPPDISHPVASWQTHHSDTVYDNAWITVSHREVTAPTGNPGIYGVVHFKNIAIGIVPLDAEGNTWLVGQQRYTLNQYSWEIPEGGGPRNTDPLLTAQRELREETGITAKKWSPLLSLHTSNSVTDELGYAFIAQELSFGASELDDTEQLELIKLPLADAVEWVMNGDITDALAMSSLLKVQRLVDMGKLIF